LTVQEMGSGIRGADSRSGPGLRRGDGNQAKASAISFRVFAIP
jgi:hypothetical protein